MKDDIITVLGSWFPLCALSLDATPFRPVPTASYLSFNWGTRFQPFCNPFELKGWKDEAAWPQPARDLAVVLYIHYISKAYEFVDTLIMILKKNNRQVRSSSQAAAPGQGRGGAEVKVQRYNPDLG
jgi:hypothetical protein